MRLFKTAVNNARTHDIIYSMAIAAPAAIAQAKNSNLPEIIGLTGGNAAEDGKRAGQWIRHNVKYKIDTFEDQNIQLPSSLLKTGSGDCKSFSMLFMAIMEAAGYNAGFRFASYKDNKPYTHVYNFVLDNKGNIITFDCCLKDLKELRHYKKIKDMRVNYIAGVPMMINDNTKKMNKAAKVIMRKPTLKELMTDDRYMNIGYISEDDMPGIGRKKKKEGGGRLKKFIKKATTKVKDTVKKGIKLVKTVGLSAARGPFLVLLDVNFRGLARKMAEARAKDPGKVNEFWLKVGGNADALNKAIDKGKDKKPFLGEKRRGVSGATSVEFLTIGGSNSIMAIDNDSEAVGFDPVTVTTAITAAAGIVAAAQKLFKNLGVKDKAEEGELTEGIDPDAPISEDVEAGSDFFANDPASEDAAQYAVTGGKKVSTPRDPAVTKAIEASSDQVTPGMGFKINPMLLAGAAAVGIFLLTRKKK